VAYKQLYWPDTNVLVTRFLSADGVGEITDYMPVGRNERHWLVRRVNCVRGAMPFHLECWPAFNFARDKHQLTLSADGASFQSPSLNLALTSSVPLFRVAEHAHADFTLQEGEAAVFVLRQGEEGADCGRVVVEAEAAELFQETVRYWRHWLARCRYQGRWREMVHRSALVLKLLTYKPTGAILAAPTCSLPETLGGERNWDYRYTWIRDAAFTLYGFLRIGFTEEAAQFMGWIENRCRDLGERKSLQIMYGIDGRAELHEEILDHLEGYKGSRPVRIGNGAYDQLQLDIVGETA
jgi:GH15 family glucan-1,4-alpha-glucosidase